MDICQAFCTHDDFSVVINNCNFIRVSICPAEADPPLVIDADAPLVAEIAPQGLEPVAWRYHERPQVDCSIEHAEFPARQPLNVLRQSPGKLAPPDGLGLLVAETPDHSRILM